ncbi:response regulator [Tautonia sp. JC769]|uniref:response regulator n=1 Tax=Tautonia sp. JC769 TaxID=3232135 RepID=UPI003458E986
MKRLLIVDDALIMRKLIRGVAEAAGWQVAAEAGDGQEAVELYRSLRPDLVTLDLVMPVMGGLDALREIRAEDPEARVIIVTALDQKETLAASIRAGAMDFIVKPFQREQMLGMLTKLGSSPDV